MKYYIGIDIGSFESKGMLIDQNGRSVAAASRPHTMETPIHGFAEHDADSAWWGDFCAISNDLISGSGVDPARIKGVGCSAIAPCCLPVDEACHPLRKAILYGVDVRAAKQIDDLNRELGEDFVLQRYGNPITSQSVGPKILWLRENEPEIYNRTYKFITASTFLVAKLTGRYTIDHYTASAFTPMYDLDTCGWDDQNLGRFCRAEQLADCLWTDEIAGTVTAAAAAQTGLAQGTPVTAGTADASADAVGAGVFRPGDMLLMFGSSVFMIHVVPKLTIDRRYWAGPYLFRDTYMVASGMSTAGTLTRWFRDELAPDLVQAQAQGRGNAYDLLMDSLEGIPPGSDGLIVLPYFSGERTPINDPAAKGVIFGLTLQHTRAHLYQACLEGVGYGIGQHLQGYAGIGMETKRLIAVGGGTKTPKWMQIVSDISGRGLLLGGVFGAAFGDALLAGLGTGGFSDIAQLEGMTKFRGRVLPNPEYTKLYASCLDKYTKLYQSTKELMRL